MRVKKGQGYLVVPQPSCGDHTSGSVMAVRIKSKRGWSMCKELSPSNFFEMQKINDRQFVPKTGKRLSKKRGVPTIWCQLNRTKTSTRRIVVLHPIPKYDMKIELEVRVSGVVKL